MRITLCSLLLLAVSSPTLPAEALEITEELLDCATESDDARRLACYDEIIARSGVTETEAESARPDAPPAEAAAALPPASSTSAAHDGDTGVGRFGMSGEAAPRQVEQQPVPEEITARIVEIREKPRGERIVYLDNGQVWEEISLTRTLPLREGDPVTIKAAAFGSYKLVGPGGKRFTRASRIQ